jgi:hypothetical protein
MPLAVAMHSGAVPIIHVQQLPASWYNYSLRSGSDFYRSKQLNIQEDNYAATIKY